MTSKVLIRKQTDFMEMVKNRSSLLSASAPMYTFYDDANNISDTEKTDSPSQVMSSMNTSISSRKHISSANSSKLQLDKLMKAIDAEKYLAEDDRELINMDLNNEPPLQEDISYIRPSSPVIVNVANKENNDPMEQINGENYHMFNGVSNGITDSLGNSGQNDKNTLLPSNLLSIEYDTLQEKHQHHHGVDSTNGTTILSGSYTSLYVSNKHDHNGTSTMWSRLPTRDHSFYAQECGSPLKNTGFIRENLASYYPLSSSSSLPTSRDVTRLPQSAAGPQNTDVTQRSMSVKKSKNITTFQKKSGGVSTRLRSNIIETSTNLTHSVHFTSSSQNFLSDSIESSATESETSNQTRKKKEVFKTKDDIGTEEKSNRILKESNVNSTRQENSISKNQEPSKKNFKKLRDFNNKSKISLSSPLKQEIKSRKTLTRKFKQDNSQVKKKKRKLSTKATIKENEVNFTTSASASTTNKESPKNLISQRPKRKISKPKYYFNESFSETSRPSSKNTKTIKPSSEASQTETFDPEIDEGDHKEVDDHSAKKTKSVKRSKKMETTYTKLSTARSRNGCWTCRLRRKKCPEEKPLCSECSRLGLKCDGYNDERPIYMNNKKAAKKRMEEIKEVTNLKKKLRMSSRSKKTV